MQHTIEIPTSVKRKLILNFTKEDVDKYLDAAIKQVAKSVDIPGFRKGKVPANIIEKRYSEEVIARANDQMINSNIQASLAKEDLHPISRIEAVEIEGNENNELKRGSAYDFACTFEVLPAITLPEYSDLEVTLPEATPDPKEFENLIHRIKQTGASLEPVEEARNPEDGDICLIDVDGTFEGKPVPGMKGENIQIQIRSDIPNAETDVQQIVRTMMVGESKNGKIKVTEEYPDPTYRGLEIDMNVKLHSISKENLPELDEEFAKRFGFDGLEGLNNFVTENVMTQQLQKIKADAQAKLMDDILEKLEFEIPPSLIAQHKHEQLMEARNFLASQGQDSKEMSETIARMEAEAEVEAAKHAKAQTFLLALAYKEKLSVSENELQEYIYKAAQDTRQDPQVIMERLYQNGAINDVSERLLASKAAEMLYARVNKVIVDKDGNKVEPKTAEDFEETIKKVAEEVEAKKAKQAEEANQTEAE